MLMSSKIRDIGVVDMKKIAFDNNKNVVSRLLKQYRIQQQMTQQDLACKMQTMGVNLDQQMISKIESNNRMVTDSELACFCIALKIQPNDLLADFLNSMETK